MSTGVAIFDWAIKTYTVYIYISPERPWITIIGLQRSSTERIEQNENNHDKTFCFVPSNNKQYDTGHNNDSWINDHCNKEKEVLKKYIVSFLHGLYYLSTHLVERPTVEKIYDNNKYADSCCRPG